MKSRRKKAIAKAKQRTEIKKEYDIIDCANMLMKKLHENGNMTEHPDIALGLHSVQIYAHDNKDIKVEWNNGYARGNGRYYARSKDRKE